MENVICHYDGFKHVKREIRIKKTVKYSFAE